MTLPTLIANYEKKVVATRAKQTYSMLSQAIKLSEAQNGEAKYWDVGTVYSFDNTEAFLKKYLLPYLKEAKFCGNGKDNEEAIKKCGISSFIFGQTYMLSNGVAVSLFPLSVDPARPDLSQDANSILINMIIDVNGAKQPNKMGYDQFQFYLYKKDSKLLPIAEVLDLTREDILNGKEVEIHGANFYMACKKSKSDDNDTFYRHGCTYLLMMDNWQIKDDYPW